MTPRKLVEDRRRRSPWRGVAALLVLLLAAPAGAARPGSPADTTRPATAASAMVVSGHPEATRAGLDVLRDGGTAVDAAVAVGFALAAVLPDAGNVGGGGFLVLREPDGRAATWDFRETAPAAASRDMFLDPSGRIAPYRSTRGHLASGVPGTVAGLALAHARGGRLPWARLVAPAVRLAESHALTERTAGLFNRYRRDFEAFPASAALFVRADGRSWRAGDVWRNPDLAQTLARIRDEGADGFYRGETARLVAAEQARGGGRITEADLAAYRAIERAPVAGRYRGYRVVTMAPPSSGGVALLATLRAVEPLPLARWGAGSPDAVHAMAEALRRVFADRAAWIGDPAFVSVPTRGLYDSLYVASRMASFSERRASASADVRAGAPPDLPYESSETTHFSIVDAEGRAVAVTTTLNDYFGSRVVVAGAGFLLNDEMDDFATAPGEPNLWGLVQGEANAVAPGKRMASSMTPVVVEDPAGRLFFVGGSPGGPRIISTVFSVLSNVIDHGMDAQAAVNAPRAHHQWLPDVLMLERAVPEATADALRARGHAIDRSERWGAPNVIVVRYGPNGSHSLEGGADPRRADDTAGGY